MRRAAAGHRWVQRATRLARRRHYPELIATMLAVLALGVGLSMLLAPGAYLEQTTYAHAMDFASPQAWGTALILNGALMLAAMAGARNLAMWPAAGLTAVFAAWAVFLILGAARGGIPTPAIGFITAAWASLGLVAVYWTDDAEGDRHAAP